MVMFNAVKNEVSYKIVYYGPPGSGKTTNLQVINEKSSHTRGQELSSIAVGKSSDLFFDFLPIYVGKVYGLATRFQLFAVPGQDNYNSVLKLILQDVDGIVFVADSCSIDRNIASLKTLEDSLKEQNLDFSTISLVLQWNKRDMPESLPIEELEKEINHHSVASFPASAITGKGIFDTIDSLAETLIDKDSQPGGIYAKSTGQSFGKRKPVYFSGQIAKLAMRPGRNLRNPELLKTQVRMPMMSRSDLPKSMQDEGEIMPKKPVVTSSSSLIIEESRLKDQKSDIVLIKLAGRIDQKSGQMLKNKVQEYYLRGSFNLMLDMESVEHLQSTAFGMFIDIANKAKMMGGGIRLVHVRDKIKLFFDMMGVDAFLPIFDTYKQALELFPGVREDEVEFEPQPPVIKKKTPVPATLNTTQSMRLSDFISKKSQNKKIFLCYSSKDEASAELIEQDLESRDFQVWRDRCRLNPDMQWSEEVSVPLKDSSFVILLWTENAQQDSWIRQEWATAIALKKQIICCLFSTIALPAPLQNFPNIPFDSYERGKVALLEALLLPQNFAVPQILLPFFSSVPVSRDEDFIGDNGLFLSLYHKLLQTRHTIIEQKLEGIEGVGKTQLALEFVYRFALAFPHGIMWINATENWEQEFIRTAYDMGLPISTNAASQTKVLIELRDYFQSHPQALIVMDGVTDTAFLEQEIVPGFSPLTCGCYLLCTTYSPTTLSPQKVARFQLETLSEDAAYRFFTSKRKPSSPIEEKSAQEICRMLGHLPLTIKMAKVFLRENANVSFKDYLQNILSSLQAQGMSISSRRLDAVAEVVLHKQLDLIRDHYTRLLLDIMCQLPSGKIISFATLSLLAGLAPDSSHLEKAIQQLIKYSLVTRLSDSKVTLHSTIHGVMSTIQMREKGLWQNFRKKSAERLFASYQDFSRLQREFYERGIDAILQDLEIATKWSGNSPQVINFSRAIMAETQNLLRFSRHEHFIIQQIYSRLKGEYRDRNQLLAILENSLLRVSWNKGSVWLRRQNYCLHEKEANDTEKFSQAVCFSPSGTQLAVSSSRGLVLWDTGINKQVQKFIDNFCEVKSIHISSDSRCIITGAYNAIEVWDIDKGEKVFRSAAHEDYVTAVAFSRDLQAFASAGRDGSIILWHTDGGYQLRSITAHQGKISCVRFSPDSSVLLSASWDKTLKLWSVNKGEVILELKGHIGPVTASHFSAKGSRILSGGKDCTIRMWEVSSGRELRVFHGHENEITSVSFSPNGFLIASCSKDRTLRLWDTRTGLVLQTFVADYPLISCCFSHTGREIFVCDQQSKPMVYQFTIMGME